MVMPLWSLLFVVAGLVVATVGGMLPDGKLRKFLSIILVVIIAGWLALHFGWLDDVIGPVSLGQAFFLWGRPGLF